MKQRDIDVAWVQTYRTLWTAFIILATSTPDISDEWHDQFGDYAVSYMLRAKAIINSSDEPDVS